MLNQNALMSQIPTLYEDESIFAISKPAGVHSIQLPNGGDESVADFLLREFSYLKNVSIESGDAGLVNRLDFSTSGILLVAKTPAVWKFLREQFTERAVRKTYLALVEGAVSKQHDISTCLGSPYRRGKKVRVYDRMPEHGRAREARTEISPMKNINEKDAALIEVKMLTGVRHQIRAHCSHAGFPLLGDTLYGSQRKLPDAFPEIQREFFLHALRLSFTHPTSRKEIEIIDASHELEAAGISLRASMS